MQVLISPDYTTTNPYLRLLADGLEDRGINVEPVDDHSLLMPVRAVRNHGVPDVLHLHWLHPFILGRSAGFTALKGAVFLLQLAVLAVSNVRVVWTVHNLVAHDTSTPRLERACKHLIVRLVDDVVIHCETADERMREAYYFPDGYDARTHIVPHGHYIDAYENDVAREEARETLGFDDEFVFLFFGRLCEYKDVSGLLQTFRDIDTENARLVIAGNPETPALGERIEAAASGDDRVSTTLEFVPEAQVQYYMNAADVVVLPFREILSSGSTVLAMSFANPVIVPEAGCIGSLVPLDGGFTYDDNGEDSLRDTMKRAIDADIDRVGQENRAAVERLDWDHIAQLTAEAYGAPRQ